jgi:hypothetical protein
MLQAWPPTVEHTEGREEGGKDQIGTSRLAIWHWARAISSAERKRFALA